MSESRENLLQAIRQVQAVNERFRTLFQQCEQVYRTMQPELQALSNRAAELMVDYEFRTRVQQYLDSDELRLYKSNVDRFFAEVAPAYGDAMEVLGEHVDEIRADPTLSELFDSVTGTLSRFRDQHRELTTLTLGLTPAN